MAAQAEHSDAPVGEWTPARMAGRKNKQIQTAILSAGAWVTAGEHIIGDGLWANLHGEDESALLNRIRRAECWRQTSRGKHLDRQLHELRSRII